MSKNPKPEDGIYAAALRDARDMLEAFPEVGMYSALKQAASDRGIPWGEPMGAFVAWAESRL